MTAVLLTPPTEPKVLPVESGGTDVEHRLAKRTAAWLKVLLPPLAAAGILAVFLPRAAGTSWAGIWSTLLTVHPLWLLAAVGVWLLGLWVQTTVQTACLPGLTRRRALLLNATGSAVSNVAPFGGAVGIEVNRRMVRHWSIGGRPFGSYVLLMNLIQLVTKLALPAVVLGVAMVAGVSLGPVASWAWTALGLLVLLTGVLSTCRPAAVADRVITSARAPFRRVRGWPAVQAPVTVVTDLREQCRVLLGRGRLRITTATVAYTLLHAVGLWMALQAVGAGVGVIAVLAALCAERAASLVLVTPAGAGFAEVAAAAVLLNFGVGPAAAAAGLLLHRLIIVGLEVPLGAMLGAGWWWRVRPRGLLMAGA